MSYAWNGWATPLTQLFLEEIGILYVYLDRDRLPLIFFFTGDLVIFCKADEEHGKLLKEILHEFYELSGHKVNLKKTNIFFSRGVREPLKSIFSNLLGYQKTQDLGHYLGVPLFHQKVTNSTMHFVVEKVRIKLQSWDAQYLSIIGRVAFAQLTLLSIPGYFMQSMMLPRKICDEIERLTRTFIWGSTEGKKKMS